jgi:ubiquitin C-terminal hydrolase
MLYAVLVHSGGAYGGHYYAYISNGQEWFKFDDSTVKKVNRNEIRKYGDFGKNSHGANAYLLFYRDVETMRKEFVSAD